MQEIIMNGKSNKVVSNDNLNVCRKDRSLSNSPERGVNKTRHGLAIRCRETLSKTIDQFNF